MAPQPDSGESSQAGNAGYTAAAGSAPTVAESPASSFVGRIKGMFQRSVSTVSSLGTIPVLKKEAEKEVQEKKQGAQFVPGFGHKGQGLHARGRRLESTDKERTLAAQEEEAKRKRDLLRRQNNHRLLEAEEGLIDSAPWNRADSGIANIAEEKRLKLEREGTSLVKTLAHLVIPERYPDKPLAGHDEIVRAKIKQATGSIVSRKLLGLVAGVDVAVREGDTEWVAAENQKKRIAQEKAEQAEQEEILKSTRKQKPSSFQLVQKKLARLFRAKPLEGWKRGEDKPRETLNEKILRAKIDAIREEQAEGKAIHDENQRVLNEVIHQYTHDPERGKRVKMPSHHKDSERHILDYDKHFLLHEKGVGLTPFEQAIPGMDDLMMEQPELFTVQENEEYSPINSPNKKPEEKGGYDYEKHRKRVHDKHAKELAERERKYLGLGKDAESVALSEQMSGVTPLPQNAQHSADLLKKRQKAILHLYEAANIPNPWQDSEAFEVFKPSFDEPDLTLEEVQRKFDHKKYVPGYYSQYRGDSKIFAFPPVAEQNILTENFREEKKKKKKLQKGEIEYDYTPGHDNNEATNTGARYKWDPATEKYIVPATNKFKDNNPRLEVFKPATTDVLVNALYKHRKGEPRYYPQAALLPSKGDLIADSAKRAQADAKLYKPFVRFKKSHVDFSRAPVRVDTSDKINICKVKKKLFKRLQTGVLSRLDYDKALAAVVAGETALMNTNGVAIPEFYGDYPDDEYFSDESSYGDEDDEGSLGDGSLTVGNPESQVLDPSQQLQGSQSLTLSGVYNSGPMSPVGAVASISGAMSPEALPNDAGGSVGGGDAGSVVDGGASVVGGASLLGGSLEGSQYTKSTRRVKREQRRREAAAKKPQYTGIVSSIMAPMIPMRILLTMGTGGKYADRIGVENASPGRGGESISTGVTHAVITDRPNRGHVQRPVKEARDPLLGLDKVETKVDNAMYMNDIDKTFNTLKKQLIDEADNNNIELTDEQVQAAGDLYKGETRTMVAQRQLFEEDSLPSTRQRVRVKMSRHRGVLKLDNKHLSRSNRNTRDFGLESSKTSEARREKMHNKKLLKIKMASVRKTMLDMKIEEEQAAHERERERNREGF